MAIREPSENTRTRRFAAPTRAARSGRRRQPSPMDTAGVVDSIDAAVDQLCACGCGAALTPDGPSSWFAAPACQHRWHSSQATNPRAVYDRPDAAQVLVGVDDAEVPLNEATAPSLPDDAVEEFMRVARRAFAAGVVDGERLRTGLPVGFRVAPAGWVAPATPDRECPSCGALFPSYETAVPECSQCQRVAWWMDPERVIDILGYRRFCTSCNTRRPVAFAVTTDEPPPGRRALSWASYLRRARPRCVGCGGEWGGAAYEASIAVEAGWYVLRLECRRRAVSTELSTSHVHELADPRFVADLTWQSLERALWRGTSR